MEKFTCSTGAISKREMVINVAIRRLIMAALLISAVVALPLFGFMRAGAQSQPNFNNATYSAGANPSAAKIGDLDGDGLNDIVVVNLQGSLQLFFNNGAGSFARTSLNGLWPSSSNALDVDIGDLNGDGRKDIAVAFSTQTGAISILLNQGNRTFAAPVNYSVCNSSKGVAIGDLDQDGDNDLADISECSKAGILINNGHGSFAFNGTYGDGSASKSIALVDLNRDGYKDIAYVNNALGNITVILNNGNATFGPAGRYYVGDLPDDLAVGDLNGDGSPDIAVAVSYYSEVFVLFNGGSGGFYGYSELYAGDAPSNITSADINGDGLLDLAVTSRGTGRLSVLINQGNYNFAGPYAFNVGQSPVDLTAGNLDGDSLPDLVAVNQGSGSITVLLSAGGTAPPPPPTSQITLTVSGTATSKAKLVDLRWSGATSSTVDIYRNGSRIATVSNTGSYTDQLGKGSRGTFKYKVCVAGGQCSNEATVSF